MVLSKIINDCGFLVLENGGSRRSRFLPSRCLIICIYTDDLIFNRIGRNIMFSLSLSFFLSLSLPLSLFLSSITLYLCSHNDNLSITFVGLLTQSLFQYNKMYIIIFLLCYVYYFFFVMSLHNVYSIFSSYK